MMGPYGDMAPYFHAAKIKASNVPASGERGNYTEEMFQTDFPQFLKKASGGTPEKLLPDAILSVFIEQANTSVLPARWGSLWRYAAGLYVAHFAALYLKTYSDGSVNAAQAAAKAQVMGVGQSATMGDTSVSYDNSAVTAGTEKWGTWNATQYGQQLVTFARQIGMGGMWCG